MCRTIWHAIIGGLCFWGVWLFDRQPIINAILFGQYNKLLNKTLALVGTGPDMRLLQLTCVYGKICCTGLRYSAGC